MRNIGTQITVLATLVMKTSPNCRPLCAPSSFSCSSKSLERRGRERWYIEASNETALSPRKLHRPIKIIFNTILQADVPTYLPSQFSGNFDLTYGPPEPLVDDEESDATFVVQWSLGLKLLQ